MLGLTAIFALCVGPLPASPATMEAHAVLRQRCARCHDGAAPKHDRGGFDFILDAARLAARGTVIPGKPGASPLLQRITDGSMPPGKKPLSGSERESIEKWIALGAPGLDSPADGLSYAKARRIALADREAAPARERQHLRYLTLGHLTSPVEATTLRLAVAKLTNSLSWHPRLTVPHPVHPALLRIDLRDYRWTARVWEKLATANPYREDEEGLVLRADWFVATASRPPFYFDFLRLPLSDKALERIALTDVSAARAEGRAARAGFNNSGVARSNRILERVDGTFGAYWRSHDFADSSGRKNIFENPVGFQADGGEIIFHLPNGLQGYLIVDAQGRRLDKAPGEVVQDPSRPDRLVETGLSCMGCHAGGILPKDDRVRPHVVGNKAFGKEMREETLSLYVPHAAFKKLVDEDNARFHRALSALKVSPRVDPILAAVLNFERVLDRARLADELNVTPGQLTRILEKVPELARAIAAGKGGTVRREVVEPLWTRLLAERTPSPAAPPVAKVEGIIKSLATVDGKTILSGGADGRVLLWKNGKARQVVKHVEAVQAVALSPDGRLLASSSGRVILVHTLAGKQIARLRGHTDLVWSLAFLDGKRLASGSADYTARVWDIARAKETAVMTGHAGAITSLAIGGAGKIVVTGSGDRSARWWNASTGKELGRRYAFESIYAVAWGPSTLVAGTAAGKVMRWDVSGEEAATVYTGAEGTPRAVRLLKDGRVAAVASREALAWLWGKGKVWHGTEVGPVTAAAIAPDGTMVAATRDGICVVPAR